MDPSDDVQLHLISCLPSESSPASHRIRSFLTKEIDPARKQRSTTSLKHCIYREDHTEPASSYIIRSGASGSRTIVNYNDLPEMSASEFEKRVQAFDPAQETWWHFEVKSDMGGVSRHPQNTEMDNGS